MHTVAPRVGAWIETKGGGGYRVFPESHPVWVRGLKPDQMVERFKTSEVAPRVGAWIETASAYHIHIENHVVAPRVGAWIET